MTSDRNNSAPRTSDDALLDAARECVLAVGLRRTTLTDVARRAGVSRMTMYRRWPDMASLVGDLMTREWGGVAATAMARATGHTARERIVAMIVGGVRDLRGHAMFRRIIELDPEVLLPYLVDRRGTSQDHILATLTEAIHAGQTDGSLRKGDPAVQARVLLLTTLGFVLSSATMTDTVTQAELDAELELLLDRFFAPGFFTPELVAPEAP